MDSPSELFSRLDLTENFTSTLREDIDDMDIDPVEEATAPTFNQRMGSTRKTHTRHWRDSGSRTFGSSSTAMNDTEQQRRRARLVQLINDTLETEQSSQNRDEVLECEQHKVCNEEAIKSRKSFEKGSKLPVSASYHPRHKGSWRKKGKEQLPVFDGGDLVLKPREKREKREGIVLSSDPFHHNYSSSNQGQRRSVNNGYIAPCNQAKSRISTRVDGRGISDPIDGETCSSFTKNSQNRMKGVDPPCVSQHKTKQGHQRWSLPKNTGPRRPVQNGYTSCYNMAQGNNSTSDNAIGTMMQDELLDGNSSHQHIVSPDSKVRHPDKKKGKMILEDNILTSGQDIKAGFHSDRLCSIVAKEVTVTVDDDNAFKSSEDIALRRHDLTRKAPGLPSEESVCVSKREQGTSGHSSDLRRKITMEYEDFANDVDDSPEITTYHRLIPNAVLAPPESETGGRINQRRGKFMEGKTKCNLICSNYGGSSSSTFENSETSDVRSSRNVPCNGLTMTCDSQNHGDISDPVMKLDELQSQEVRCNNLPEQSTRVHDHSSSRVSQVESDEILARQLQEQFYDEVAGSADTEEIDATIAWSLQQEDARLPASTARNFQSDHREASMAHLYSYYAQLPYRNSSARWSDRAQSRASNRRRNYYGSEIDLETRMIAEVRNFTGMDLETRRNFLEALEAAFDHSNDELAENTLGTHHDFNENDYEMLLALDENIHQHIGASESQINSLPQSVIQSDNVEEACAVCLENPAVGDIIRHLPCLHKFHKECIDPWLRRRTWCPVCKSEIN